MGPVHGPSSEDWRQPRRDHYPLSATPSNKNGHRSSVPSQMADSGRDKRASRALTQASLQAMAQAWDSPSSPSTTSSTSSLHPSDCPILPDESVSVVCGFHTKPEDDPAADIYIASGDEMHELSGADWRRSLSKRFATMHGFYKYVQAWNSKMPAPAPPLDLAGDTKRHWQCAVDSMSGELLDPVVFPDTLRDESVLDSDRMNMRRRTRTSNAAAKEYTILFRRGKKGKTSADGGPHEMAENVGEAEQDDANKENEAPKGSQPNNSVLPEIKEEEEKVACSKMPLRTLDVTMYQQAASVTPDSGADGPDGPDAAKTAEYYIRPAGVQDMKGVQEIYNLEVVKGTQARDIEPLEEGDLVSILETCHKGLLPFLVAISGPGKADAGQDGPETVLGFGFLSVYEPGLAGGLNGTSRYSVKANVFVHMNKRQKGVGGALLSKLLELCSFNYTAKKEHVVPYVCTLGTDTNTDTDTDKGTYRSCRESPRQYHQVFAEVLYGSERGLAEMWYDRVLSRDFGFQCLGKGVIGTHWSTIGRCWLSKLVFQHDCYPPVEDVAVAATGTETRTPTRSPSYRDGREETASRQPSMEPTVEPSPSQPVSSQLNGGAQLGGNQGCEGRQGHQKDDTENEHW